MFFCNSVIWRIVTGIHCLRVKDYSVHLAAVLKAEKGNKKGIKSSKGNDHSTGDISVAACPGLLCTGSICVSDTANHICLSVWKRPSSL